MTRKREEQRRQKDLERENKELRRKLARAERRLEKEGPPEPAIEEDSEEDSAKAEEDIGRKCPKCGSKKLKEYTTPSKVTVIGCTECRKWRKRLK